jgi:hypothetical protein
MTVRGTGPGTLPSPSVSTHLMMMLPTISCSPISVYSHPFPLSLVFPFLFFSFQWAFIPSSHSYSPFLFSGSHEYVRTQCTHLNTQLLLRYSRYLNSTAVKDRVSVVGGA